jgi:hypothetical protein
LRKHKGFLGVIVPVSSISADRYESLQTLLKGNDLHYSSFDDRPSRLFDGLEHIRLTIHLIGQALRTPTYHSTRYNKWSKDERGQLFTTLEYTPAKPALIDKTMPKLSSSREATIVERLMREGSRLSDFLTKAQSGYQVLYSRKLGYFLQVLDFEPIVLDGNGNRRPPSEFKTLLLPSQELADATIVCLNSSLFYWFVTAFSDCRHLNKRELELFPIDLIRLIDNVGGLRIADLRKILMTSIKENSENRLMKFKHDSLTVQHLYPRFSKPIIDEIDQRLSKHYGFTDEELDLIINYDIKYRMGADSGDSE